jgi:hypothetical protein
MTERPSTTSRASAPCYPLQKKPAGHFPGKYASQRATRADANPRSTTDLRPICHGRAAVSDVDDGATCRTSPIEQHWPGGSCMIKRANLLAGTSACDGSPHQQPPPTRRTSRSGAQRLAQCPRHCESSKQEALVRWHITSRGTSARCADSGLPRWPKRKRCGGRMNLHNLAPLFATV